MVLIGGVGLGVASGLTISGLAPVGILTASSISFVWSISTLITNEYFSKLKTSYTKKIMDKCNYFVVWENIKSIFYC